MWWQCYSCMRFMTYALHFKGFMVEVYVFELHYKGFIFTFCHGAKAHFLGCIKLLRYQDSAGYG
jgi:hypothetical protein